MRLLIEIIDGQAEIIKQQRKIIKKALIKNQELENYINQVLE